MLIAVQASDIAAAKKGKGCPIEIACQRVFKQRIMSIGVEAMFLAKTGAIHNLPTEAQLFAESYDAGVKVHPMTFTLGEGY